MLPPVKPNIVLKVVKFLVNFYNNKEKEGIFPERKLRRLCRQRSADSGANLKNMLSLETGPRTGAQILQA